MKDELVLPLSCGSSNEAFDRNRKAQEQRLWHQKPNPASGWFLLSAIGVGETRGL